MGWAFGYDHNKQRDIGYGVEAWCDSFGCPAKIDRGLAYVCGGKPYGGEVGCGDYFCGDHLFFGYIEEPDTLDGHSSPQLCFDCVAKWRAATPREGGARECPTDAPQRDSDDPSPAGGVPIPDGGGE